MSHEGSLLDEVSWYTPVEPTGCHSPQEKVLYPEVETTIPYDVHSELTLNM